LSPGETGQGTRPDRRSSNRNNTALSPRLSRLLCHSASSVGYTTTQPSHAACLLHSVWTTSGRCGERYEWHGVGRWIYRVKTNHVDMSLESAITAQHQATSMGSRDVYICPLPWYPDGQPAHSSHTKTYITTTQPTNHPKPSNQHVSLVRPDHFHSNHILSFKTDSSCHRRMMGSVGPSASTMMASGH
jgi:hypothetical protein